MNRRAVPVLYVVCLFVLVLGCAAGSPRAIPSEVFPAPFGVNIHYTKGAPGETAMLAKAFRVVRTDFVWAETERRKGVYDFSAYDSLLREMDTHGLTPLFILVYGNSLYRDGPAHSPEGPPRTPASRAAFARWAAAAAGRYRNRKIMWEVWNEPNTTGFWGGLDPNPEEYARLVNDTGPAMRKADPDCTLVIGAAGLDWDWIDALMRHGALRWADSFSVHPYRSGGPEPVVQAFARLRRMMHRHAPGRDIPIISSEWGYSTNTRTGVSEEQQAQFLVRMRLVHASQGVRTSIWYDWKDDGSDPANAEHRFGTVTQGLEPKPSYTAARVMNETLAGYRFARMLVDKPGEYVMLLRNGAGETALALWTTGKTRAFRVQAPIRSIVKMDGERSGGSAAVSTVVYFDGSPRYVLLGRSPEMDARTMWWWVKPHTVVDAGKRIDTPGITIKNTTREARRYKVDVDVEGGTHDVPHGMSVRLEPGEQKTIPVAIRIRQRLPETRLRVTVRSASEGGPEVVERADIPLTVANPLILLPGPVDDSAAQITLETPVGGPGEFTVALTGVKGLHGARPVKVTVPPNQDRTVVRVPVQGVEATYSYGVRVLDANGLEAAVAPPVRYHRIYPLADGTEGTKPRGLSIRTEGDAKPGGSATLIMQRDPERGMVMDIRAVFPDGWRYLVVIPEQTAIPEGAVAVGMWVDGDGSGDYLRCRFRDAKGQIYQPTYGRVDWIGWRWVTMRLDDPTVDSWGGPKDGRIHQPITWNSILLLDSALQKAHTAHVQIDDVTVMTKASP